MASHIIGRDQLHDLQINLVRSHAVGAGAPLPEEFVLAAMVARLNTFLQGGSGVSEGLVRHLALFIERRIVPIVPEHGAVGTSGDLVQLAHIALALIGEGEVFHDGKRVPTARLLKKLAIPPYVPPPQGGPVAHQRYRDDDRHCRHPVGAWRARHRPVAAGRRARAGAGPWPSVMRWRRSFTTARPHVGQQEAAGHLRELLKGSQRLTERSDLQARVDLKDEVHVTPEQIQEIYSLRCIPQVVGPALDIWRKVEGDVATELNSVTDNPIVDTANRLFLHGGNFHGDYIAAAMDQLKIGMVKLTILSERRIDFFLNRNANRSFPPFLNLEQPGLSLALQGVQFVATSTTAHSSHSPIPIRSIRSPPMATTRMSSAWARTPR